jgi:V8-like Glu-specific endopeptidase
VATSHVTPSQARAVLRYWTPARMRAARPLDAGPGEARAGGGDEPTATTSVRNVTTTTTYPFVTAGRIFLKTRRKKGFCSGVAVNTPSRRVVLTAAHCLRSREGTARSAESTRFLEFVPAYSGGNAPFGRFVMETSFLLEPWIKSENLNFDMAAVTTYPNSAGQSVADAVGGGAEIGIDLGRSQEFTIVGYPGFNQQRMKFCTAKFVGLNPFSHGVFGPPQTRANCFIRPGSSGGPWFVGEPPVLDGLTSEDVRLQAFTHFVTTAYFSSVNVGALLEDR